MRGAILLIMLVGVLTLCFSSVTSTVLDPGGTFSFPSQPQVKTVRRGGSTATYSPMAVWVEFILT